MSNVGNSVSSTVNGAENGASAGSSFGGWGSLIGGILGGAGGLAGGLLSSSGSSTAQMLSSLEKYYQPTKAGWSWAQLENQVAIEQFRKQLASSAKADLDLSRAMNEQLPTAQVAGLRAAGLNPILAVLGSGFSPIQSSASAGGASGGARLPSGFTRPSRHVNSAGSALDFAKIIGGAIDADVDNRQADTQNKQALTGNIKAQTDLIDAQVDKTKAEAEGIRDKISHGSSWISDLGREARTASPYFSTAVEFLLNLFGFGSPDAVNPDHVSQRSGNSAKQPGIVIELPPPTKSGNPKYSHLPSINEYNERGE